MEYWIELNFPGWLISGRYNMPHNESLERIVFETELTEDGATLKNVILTLWFLLMKQLVHLSLHYY